MNQITELKENEIFVFGSNLAGIHGAGAAKTAYREFGAELHVGEGMTGRCYAIPTKDEKLRVRPIEDIGYSILKFINTAKRRPDLTFWLRQLDVVLQVLQLNKLLRGLLKLEL